ncbi:universal stress protein PHOS32 [Cinnamomum micranthum f. kanehirae]|uniref:Universal stress protein PHOS32 n=1 Tax=Cinnamomum micranthum f. kanehirae TaxID=337451 RepID=A0A443P8Q4_9MAGN|nr:universal stress protein PHOS32 [Cinnamomum micranthum f. kanehirae]
MAHDKKKVVLVGVNSSIASLYSLEWTLDHLIAPIESQFKIVLVHVKTPAMSVLRFAGPGAGDMHTMVEANLRKSAAAIMDRAKDLCQKRSISDYVVEVGEGDARNVLCQAVENHRADILVVGSQGYGKLKRTILGSVSDYCAHHAHCSVLVIKKPKLTKKH